MSKELRVFGKLAKPEVGLGLWGTLKYKFDKQTLQLLYSTKRECKEAEKRFAKYLKECTAPGPLVSKEYVSRNIARVTEVKVSERAPSVDIAIIRFHEAGKPPSKQAAVTEFLCRQLATGLARSWLLSMGAPDSLAEPLSKLFVRVLFGPASRAAHGLELLVKFYDRKPE